MIVDPTAVILMILGVVMTIAFFGHIVADFIISILTNKAAKTIKWADWKHLTLAFIFKSNHQCEVAGCRVHANGYLETLGKKHHRIPILRPSYTNEAETFSETDLTGEDYQQLTKLQQKTVKDNLAVSQLEKEILTPSTLEGTRIPCYFVYDGVAVAMSPNAVLALSQNSQVLNGEVVNIGGDKSVFKFSCLLPLNPSNAKKHISKLIDQTSMDAAYEDGKAEGLLEGRNERMTKLIVYAGLGMMILGAVMLMAGMFL